MSTRDQLDKISQKGGVEGLCQLARLLGYKDPYSQLMNRDGSCVGDLLAFFEDNPGAIEAVIDWVSDREWDELDDTEKCDDCDEELDDCVCDEPTGDDNSDE